jgi:hypothetical protein
MGLGSVYFGFWALGSGFMHKLSAGNNGILAMGKGDNALPTDDDNNSLCTDNGSNVLSHDGDATTLIIGTINANSSFSAGDVLAVISGCTIGAICGGGSNLDVDALHVGNDDSMKILLGNYTTVVLVSDDHGSAIWHRPCDRTTSERGSSPGST